MSPTAAHTGDLFTASDVARFCQVDLKTIHNWAEKGAIPHFRTPGRHLRFRRVDIIDFLRKYQYPIPDILRHARARIALVSTDADILAASKRSLSKRFEVTLFQDPLDALVAVATLRPDAIILDLDTPTTNEGLRVLGRLRANDATNHVRVIVVSSREDQRDKARAQGALGALAKDDVGRLRDVLEHHLGIG